MHASAFAAGVVYWQAPTLQVLAAVRELRGRGTAAFATMDAGPHVKVLVRAEDSETAGRWLRAVPCVTNLFEARAADGAMLVESDDEGGAGG